MSNPQAATLQRTLRDALRSALRRRDAVATAVLRSVVAAIQNAEAVSPDAGPAIEPGVIAGGVAGVGTADVARRALTDDDVARIVRGEAHERQQAAAEYERLGRPDHAARLRAEAAVITAHLP